MDQRLQDPAGAAPPDWRGLCEELISLVERCPVTSDTDWIAERNELIVRVHGARHAALAQPEPEVVGPTDEELLELWQGWNLGWDPQKGMVLMPHPAEYARAVLARWGRPVPAPAEGEVEKAPAVTEVIAWLRTEAEIDDGFELTQSAAYQRRAAELLERQAAPVPGAPYREVADLVVWLEDHSAECLELDRPEWSKFIAKAAKFLYLYLKAAPVPVPVSERLPGPEDCDAEGRVWLYRPQTPILNPYWDLVKLDYIDPVPPTHWLPAKALPLPQGEVES